MLATFLAIALASASAGGESASVRIASVVPAPVTAVAAGDIASCEGEGDAETATLVRELDPDVVLTLGDNAYPSGAPDEFARCYEPTWGAFRERTRPAPGNHDYATPGAAGYFGYFGERAPSPYYGFDLGAWHIVSLNSELDHDAASPQVRWLRADLRRDRHRCELLYWHRPRWNGGRHPPDATTQPLWQAAFDYGVDVVLAGHEHSYQRFRRLDARGRPDRRHGVQQLIVGTGGRSLYALGPSEHRVAASASGFGVVELALRARGYSLRFVPAAGGTYTDRFRWGTCHGSPPRS
jgi:acid phosphatase type 7